MTTGLINSPAGSRPGRGGVARVNAPNPQPRSHRRMAQIERRGRRLGLPGCDQDPTIPPKSSSLLCALLLSPPLATISATPAIPPRHHVDQRGCLHLRMSHPPRWRHRHHGTLLPLLLLPHQGFFFLRRGSFLPPLHVFVISVPPFLCVWSVAVLDFKDLMQGLMLMILGFGDFFEGFDGVLGFRVRLFGVFFFRENVEVWCSFPSLRSGCGYSVLMLGFFSLLQADKIATLVKAAGVQVEGYWPALFAKLCEKRSVEDLITNVGGGKCRNSVAG